MSDESVQTELHLASNESPAPDSGEKKEKSEVSAIEETQHSEVESKSPKENNNEDPPDISDIPERPETLVPAPEQNAEEQNVQKEKDSDQSEEKPKEKSDSETEKPTDEGESHDDDEENGNRQRRGGSRNRNRRSRRGRSKRGSEKRKSDGEDSANGKPEKEKVDPEERKKSREEIRKAKKERYRERKEKERAREAAILEAAPPVEIEGLVEISPKGFGFLRDRGRNFHQSPKDDVFITPEVVRKYSLRDGLWVKCISKQGARGPQLVELLQINGKEPEEYQNLPYFDELTAINPNKAYKLETIPTRYTTRVIDMLAPIGRGQRGLIVAPPRTGENHPAASHRRFRAGKL